MPQVIDNTTESRQPKIVQLLREKKISFRLIARSADVSPDVVIKALNPEKFGTVSHANLMRIRERTLALLDAAGIEYSRRTIWSEFDNVNEAA